MLGHVASLSPSQLDPQLAPHQLACWSMLILISCCSPEAPVPLPRPRVPILEDPTNVPPSSQRLNQPVSPGLLRSWALSTLAVSATHLRICILQVAKQPWQPNCLPGPSQKRKLISEVQGHVQSRGSFPAEPEANYFYLACNFLMYFYWI